jgi:hypothetical protein
MPFSKFVTGLKERRYHVFHIMIIIWFWILSSSRTPLTPLPNSHVRRSGPGPTTEHKILPAPSRRPHQSSDRPDQSQVSLAQSLGLTLARARVVTSRHLQLDRPVSPLPCTHARGADRGMGQGIGMRSIRLPCDAERYSSARRSVQPEKGKGEPLPSTPAGLQGSAVQPAVYLFSSGHGCFAYVPCNLDWSERNKNIRMQYLGIHLPYINRFARVVFLHTKTSYLAGWLTGHKSSGGGCDPISPALHTRCLIVCLLQTVVNIY